MKTFKSIALAALFAFSGYSATINALLNPPMFLTGTNDPAWLASSNYLRTLRFLPTNAASMDTFNTNIIVTNLNTSVLGSNIYLLSWAIPPSNHYWIADSAISGGAAGVQGTTNIPSGNWDVSWDVKKGSETGELLVRPELWINVTNATTNRMYIVAFGESKRVTTARQTLTHKINIPPTALTNNLHQLPLLRMRAINVTGTNVVTVYTGGTNSWIRVPQAYQLTHAVTNVTTNLLTSVIDLRASKEFGVTTTGRGSLAANNTNYIGFGFQMSPDGVNWQSELDTNNLLWIVTSPLGSNAVTTLTNIANLQTIPYLKLAWITNNTCAATTRFWLTNVTIFTK